MLQPVLSFELTLALLFHVFSLTFNFFFLVCEGARQGRPLINNSWVPRIERTRVLLVQTRLLGYGRRQLVIGLFKWASLLYRVRNSDHHFGVLAWIGRPSQLWLLIIKLKLFHAHSIWFLLHAWMVIKLWLHASLYVSDTFQCLLQLGNIITLRVTNERHLGKEVRYFRSLSSVHSMNLTHLKR